MAIASDFKEIIQSREVPLTTGELLYVSMKFEIISFKEPCDGLLLCFQ